MSDKPVAKIRTPRKKAEKINLPPEIQRPAEVEDEIDPRAEARRRLDPLTDMLGQKSYIYKARFHWLKYDFGGVKYALDVERYYEGLALCVDIRIDDHDKKMVPMKRLLCETNGLQYFYLDSEKAIEEMLGKIKAAA